ncbi:MAG: hypothetical protein OES18_23725, partial [Deltaproteobacteria bacterium]|nr:hypothetical protein [Deltaproteobacteria bacterium]
SNVQNVTTQKDLSGVSVIWILVIRICFEFRYSDFGFSNLCASVVNNKALMPSTALKFTNTPSNFLFPVL